MPYSLNDFYHAPEREAVDRLLKTLDWPQGRASDVQNEAMRLIEAVRTQKRPAGELEVLLRHYGLDTEEGRALMALAEAYLRIPDIATRHALLSDKIGEAEWKSSKHAEDWLVSAAQLGLGVTKRTINTLIGKLGAPVMREAVGHSIRLIGRQFVLGRTIDEAIKNADPQREKGYGLSYDMLGEGARTREDAENYFEAYAAAITRIGEEGTGSSGISVKLSALHPRYNYAQEERCVPELQEKLLALSKLAAQYDLSLTVDAEEADRLDTSLKIIEGVFENQGLAGWHGFGLAVQAYQKRAPALIEHLHDLAKATNRRLQVRLVKGAYWDTEIKRAQVGGHRDYPVFTRKENTDLSYLACAQRLLAYHDLIYPKFGTHNAHTMAAVIEIARFHHDPHFEFQRLHGMGQALHDLVLKEGLARSNIYAPVGSHENLLPYLVRRLLENGANSSFVKYLFDTDKPVNELVVDPVHKAADNLEKKHTKIPLPEDIYMPSRKNSYGIDLADPVTRKGFLPAVHNAKMNSGAVPDATEADIQRAFDRTRKAFPKWNDTPADKRAGMLRTIGDLYETHSALFVRLLCEEGGKTIPDALAEIREAVDFCRYYVAQGEKEFNAEGLRLPGPTGEENRLILEGRGTWVCISPWNFPLAIFTGQVVAALMAGNCVVAKPAEQTPRIARQAITFMHEAGIPNDVLHLLCGAGNVGGALVAHKDVAGVAFTGSTEVAQLINRTLAGKDGPIVPLIAETGGQNAMIVDSSALPEQVVDDVVLSAFGSAGQRCSALRILCLQEDIADNVLRMLKGAMAELKVGAPLHLSTDIGPVIDKEAFDRLRAYKDKMASHLIYKATTPSSGHYIAPSVYEVTLDSLPAQEVFGPVLHALRFKADTVDKVIDRLNALGYGLTFGVHSRIAARWQGWADKAAAGNIYINRGMTGAVVGTQPFGGRGLSGTGPKAGGPHYLHRFAHEKTLTVNVTASGGNTDLIMLADD